MKVLTKNDIVVAISNKAEVVSNGILLDDYILGIPVGNDGKFIGDVPIINDVTTVNTEIKEQKYCYTKDKGFYLNQNYVEPINAETELKALKEQVNALNIALAGMMGV